MANTVTVFGPETFTRGYGKPVAVSRTFPAENLNNPYTFEIDDSGVSSAVVYLNGQEVFGPSNCHNRPQHLTKIVSLQAKNELRVEVRGKPGSQLTIQIYGELYIAPVIESLNPASGMQGQQGLAVSITGQNIHWQAGSTTADFGPGISVVSLRVISPQTASAVLNIDVAAAVGPRDVSLATGSEIVSKANAFTVTPGSLPSALIVPNSGQQGQQNLQIAINGQNTHFVQGVTNVDFGGGVQVGSLTVNSPTKAIAALNIDPGPSSGFHLTFFPPSTYNSDTAVMDSSLGTTGYTIEDFESVTLVPGLTIQISGGVANATWTSLPNLFDQSACSNVTTAQAWDGSHVSSNQTGNTIVNCSSDPGTTASRTTFYLNPGVTSFGIGLSNFQSLNPLATDFPVANHELFVNGIDMGVLETLAGNAWQPGLKRNAYLRIDGVNGGVITSVGFENIPPNPDVLLFDHIALKPAPLGPRDVTITTDAEIVKIANGFTVTPAPLLPSIASITPNIGYQGQQNLRVQVSSELTNFVQGTTQVSFGPGVTVNAVSVRDATDLAADITIAPDATLGPRDVSFTTGSEVEVAKGGFTVQQPTSTTLTINPTSGSAGAQNLSISITGAGTHFAQGTTQASFGAGITIASLTVNSLTSATVVVNIDPQASAGPRDVSLTTGSEIATLKNGFTITSSSVGSLVVNAGQSQSVALPGPVTLNGSASGGSGAITITWSQLSGPATASFSDVHALNPSVSFPVFSKSGDYVFQLSGTDGVQTVSATVTITATFCAGGKDSGVRMGNGGLGPIVTLPDGRVRSYGGKYAGGSGATLSFISPDGLSWTQEPGVRLQPAQGQGLVSSIPGAIVQLPNGSFRSYYHSHHGDYVWRIYSAISADGLNWSDEGLRIDSGGPFGCGSVELGTVTQPSPGLFRMFYTCTHGYPSPSDVISATSIDGLNFVNEGKVANLTTPSDIVALPDGKFRAFDLANYVYQLNTGPSDLENIGSALSSDQLNWSPESGTRIDNKPGSFDSRVTQSIHGPFTLPDTSTRWIYTGIGDQGQLNALSAHWCAIGPYNPPSVVAGADQQITLPTDTVTLLAIETDDQPAGAQRLYQWSAVSGPGNVSFVDASSLSTTAQFSSAGRYQLRLTAFDGKAYGYGDLSVLVLSSSSPALLSLSGTYVSIGATGATISVTGSATHFQQGSTTLDFGPGVTVSNISVSSPTALSAQVSVDLNAVLGSRTLTVTSGSEVVDLPNALILTPNDTAPSIDTVTPNSGQQGEANLSIALHGLNTNWTQAQTTANFGQGITIVSLTVTDFSHATAVIDIDTTATVGPRDLTLTTGSEIATALSSFTVQPSAPSLVTISPNFGPQGLSGPVGIIGQNTHFQQGVTTVDFGPGITVSNVNVGCSTCLTAQLSVSPTAALGPRTVTVTTGSEVVSSSDFSVTQGASTTPILISIAPINVRQAESVSVAITGQNTHWTQGTTQVSFGLGITTTSVSVTNPSALTAQITVDPSAAIGFRTVTVGTGAEIVSVANIFNVQLASTGTPIIYSLNPGGGQQGQQGLSVMITGQNTNWTSGTTTANFGPGITVASLSVASATSATAVLNIDPAAALGPRTVALTTGAEVASFQSGFAVTPPPQALILTLDPGGTSQGAQNVSVAVAGSNTHWAQGTTTASFGAGITVVSLTVTSPTAATAVINVDPAAPLGLRTVTLTTGSEAASYANSFNIVPPPAGITEINPGGAPAGTQNLSVSITAQSTHWAQGSTTATFGAGVTVVSLTITSMTSATAIVNVDPSAAQGPRDVTFTTNSEVITAPGGFTIGSGVPVITQVSPAAGQQGQSNLAVSVTGQSTHFAQGTTQVSFGAGVVVSAVTVASPTSLTATISIAANATSGTRTVTAQTGTETASLSNAFTVSGLVTLTSATPNTGFQGDQNLTVIITGQNTHFAQGTSSVSFGAGVTVTSVSVASTTSLTATINIDPNAAPGQRSIVVTTGAESASLNNGFAVQPPSTITVSPSTGIQGKTVTVTITDANAAFVAGKTFVRFGPGIIVGTNYAGDFGPVTVTSPTTGTAQLTILSTALTAPRTVTLQTPSQTDSGIAFTVIGSPILFSANPNRANQGQSLAVTVNGEYTHFLQGSTTLDFGAGISVGAVTVNSSTSATAQLTISGSAPLGPRTITAQTGSETASTALNFSVLGPVTGPPPEVAITSPSEAATITAPTTITGTVTSPNLDHWTLSIQPAGATSPVQIAQGTTAAVSGTLDPTLLLNGDTTISLTGIDTSGQTATATTTVILTRNLKIGNFTVSFQDLSLPVAGFPIQVIRIYDSRYKANGDFGVGWRLDLNTIQLAENITLDSGWTGTASGGLINNYCVNESTTHTLTVTLADGTTYTFIPSLTGNCQQIVPPSQVTVGFAPSGTTPPNAGLQIMGSNLATLGGNFPGNMPLLDSDGAPFDPDQYILTLPDGRKLQVSRQVGLQKLTDLNGNTLTVTPGGIVSSTGKSVAFLRDAQNRIQQITDPNGNKLIYSYDTNGDLASFADAGGNTSTYTYDSTHDLLTIKDPSGNQPIRNDYDAAGRLVSHTDAYGNVINYTNDPNTNQEVVTDRNGNVTVNEYDSAGNIVKVTDALGGTTLRTYDVNGNVTSETNALGATTTYTYDANNNRTSQTDALGDKTAYTYSATNQVLSVTDANGNQTKNTYDSTGNLTSSVDAAGNQTTYTYNAQGLRTSMKDAVGNTTTYQYDPSGNLSQQTDALQHVTSYTYDANGNKTSQAMARTTASGSETLTTTYAYDNSNRLIQTTYPDGSTTQVQYNAIGKQSVTIDQLSRQTTYQYDLMGRLIQTTYPDGTNESLAYDANGNRVSSTDRGGRKTVYVYDSLNRLEKTIYPDQTFTSTVYDAAGQVISVADANGHITQYKYDAAGRRTSVVDAGNNTTSFAYDANGNQISTTDANSNTTQYQYDKVNRQTKITFADGSISSTAYDALGRTIAKTDQANLSTQYLYDPLGRLVQVTDALGQITRYGYDEVGNRISQTNANNHATNFAYDKLGRRTQRALPAGQTETMAYDPAGNLASHTDFNGKTTTFSYDASNRLTTKTPDASFKAAAISFTYSATGQRLTMQDASGTTTYQYDARDHLTQKTTPEGTLSYSYDAAGNLTGIQSSNANGTNVSYAYDAQNRLSAVKDNRLAIGTTTYGYDNVGNLQGYMYPNGVQTACQYNTLNRLTNLSITKGSTAVATYAYTLGPAGNRLQVTEGNGRQATYTYDNLYRLTGETIAGDPSGVNGAIGYVYDPVGNRTQRTSTVNPVPAATYSYDADDRLTSDTYDTNGNTTGSSGKTYAYDFENHLIDQNGNQVAIVYDGDGNRVAETVNGVTTQYLVDDRNLTGYAQVVEELSGGAVQRVYTYGLNRISQSQASGTSFYGYGGHGSVRLLTDTSGGITDRYDYDAFGNVISQLGSTPNVYLYSGEQSDPNLGFYYLRARYLDPSSGRFKSVDTFEGNPYDPGTLHRYLYVHGNPVNLSDPSGLLTLQDQILTVSIIATLESIAVIHIATNRLEQQGGKFSGVFASLRTGVDLTGTGFSAGFDIAYDFDSGHSCAIPTIELGISATRGSEPTASGGLGLYTGETACDGHLALGSTVNVPLNFYKLGSVITAPLAPKLPFSGLLTRLANTAKGSALSVSIGIAGNAASFALTYNGGLGITATLAGQPYPLDSDLAALRSLFGTAVDNVIGTLHTVAGWGSNFTDIDAHAGDFTALVPQF